MVITHNMEALVANNNLAKTNLKIDKSSKKLSSGYRINSASDDAAGLSISEKMRIQIRGLMKGTSNVEEGVSLCQVADGALEEVHAILHRISELAVQSANDTLTDDDRKATDDEVQQLISEIDRIGMTTTFNDIHILGKASGDHSQKAKPSTSSKIFQLLGGNMTSSGFMSETIIKGSIPDSQITFDMSNYAASVSNNPYVGAKMDFGALGGNLSSLSGCEFYVNCCTDCCPKVVRFTEDTGLSYSIGISWSGDQYLSSIDIGLKKQDGTYYTNASDFNKYIIDSLRQVINPDVGPIVNEHVQFAYSGSTFYVLDVDNANWDPTDKQAAYFCDVNGHLGGDVNGFWIQSGHKEGVGLKLSISGVSGENLGILGLNTLTQESSSEAIGLVNEAVNIVSSNRSRIGSYQNRFEHMIDNQNNTIENVTNAESRIRDTDMATEYAHYSANNIIRQAGQAMLAQANQKMEGVMQLLQ